MSSTSREWWNEISPYLDEVLEVPEGERGAWLASLREAQPSIAAQLETLLSEHDALAKENFLEQRAAWVQEPELAGQSLGPYKLLHAIGHGGMGSVWLAERSDGRFDRRVAVKFLSIALVGGGGKERFKREGSILGRLVHPHITELLDAGVSETGYPYLVLEHVDGQPIDVYCDQHQLSVRDRLRLFLDVLAAAAHAHANLIVHRDLKPSNVLVSNQGQVKLLDFGIAKLLEEGPEGSATLLTREHGGALTPEYAAPEQLTGRPVTTATDIYALGLLLYVLLAGRHPIGPGQHSPAELVKAIADTEPLPLSEVATRKTDADNPAEISANRGTTPDKLSRVLRGDLDTIVAKALKKNPQERYSSVAAFADDIQRYLDNEPISARPDTVRYRVVKFVNRNRTTVVLAAVALVALLAGAVATLVQAHRAREQRDFAFRQLSRAEAINDLNNFLLSDAAPSGKPFTVNELLDRAEHIVRREHADDATQVELLISIGGQYSSLDEEAKASSVLEEAYQSSRNLSDPSIRAQAACALGATLAKQSELDRAEALYREGMKELPDAPQYSLDRYYCLKRGARIAAEQGASAEPVARAEAALHVLETSPLASDRLRFSAYMDLGEAYRAAGRYREAIAAFQKTSVFMTALGRDDTENAGTLFNNWGLAMSASGRVLESEPLLRRAIEISRAGKTEDAVSPTLLTNYARVLRSLARLDEAQEYADRAFTRAQQSGLEVTVNQCLLLREGIYRDKHDLKRATAMLDEVEPRLRANLPAGHYVFAGLASERALIELDRGNLRNALQLADQGVALLEATIKAGGQGSERMPITLVQRSSIELAAGRADLAMNDATRALGLLQSANQEKFSSLTGQVRLALARALQAQNKNAEARTEYLSAAEQFEPTLGPEHPFTRTAKQLAAALPSQ